MIAKRHLVEHEKRVRVVFAAELTLSIVSCRSETAIERFF